MSSALRHLRRTAGRLARGAGLDKAYYRLKFPAARIYQSPSEQQLAFIEKQLVLSGVEVADLVVNPAAYRDFKSKLPFPLDYHGGVWEEKVLEHFLAFDLLGIAEFGPDDLYIDIAAGSSPWAQLVREKMGINAYALDLNVAPAYSNLDYYRQQDATASDLADATVRGASLQCAYEMFSGESDIRLIHELARILVPGGKTIIAPLYMHTHYCSYSTPEYWGKGCSDSHAVEYLRIDCRGVPSSRKYDAMELRRRVLNAATSCGLQTRVLALRNKQQLGPGIYCHFVLEFTRPQ